MARLAKIGATDIDVIPRFEDEPGKDRIGLPWNSVPGNLDEIKRIGSLLP